MEDKEKQTGKRENMNALDQDTDQKQTAGSEEQDSSETMDMATLLAQEEQEAAQAAAAPAKGSFLQAKVVSIIKDGVLVDIGSKSEALIPMEEFSGPPPFAVGDTISVARAGGQRGDYARVSWRAARDRMSWEGVEKAFQARQPIQAVVKNETKGGLLAECDNGLTAFIPASQVDVRPTHDLKRWKGKTITAYIMEFDIRKNNLVLSRKQWLAEENQKKKAGTLTELKVGEIRKGVVTGVTSFGAFVDIGGIEGLLHIGELEWAHTSKVSDVLKLGQEVEVKIIKFDPTTEKISLSRKELLPHPWENVQVRFPVGETFGGKVTTLTDFGAFVELIPQVEGLVHVTEIAWQAEGKKPQDLLKVGQAVQVKVLSVNPEKEKISLSIKRTTASPWDSLAQKYPVGSTAKVVVTSLVPFGAFARLPEGIEGLIHVSDFFWAKRVRHPEDVVKVGEELEVKILEVDREKEKLSFGVKQLKPSPYESYTKGARVTCTVTRVIDSGAFVELEPEIEAFIPYSEISSEKFDKVEDVAKVGEKVEAKVTQVDVKERKIQLSIKQLERDLQRAAQKKYSGKTPGPVLGELLDS